MSDQTYLLIKLAAGVACLLLALIPAFIGKHKGYRFITYYTFGAASFLLALILALAVRPRKKRDPEEDIPSFRPGQVAVYLAVVFAALYTFVCVYSLFARTSFLQAIQSGAVISSLSLFAIKKFSIAFSLWALAGGLLAALNTRSHRRALVTTLLALIVFFAVALSTNLNSCFYSYSDGFDAYYLMPFIVGIYVLALVFALYNEDRPVSITVCIAGIICAALYTLSFFLLMVHRVSVRILLNVFLDGTPLWTFSVITALAAVLGGLSKKAVARRAAVAAIPAPQIVAQPPAQEAPIPPVTAKVEAPALPSMVVFAAESANAASMAMFGNTQQYYTPEYCISRVRGNFQLPADARIDYVARAKWNGPVPELAGDQFKIDLPLIQRLQKAYLTAQLGLSEDSASAAVGRAQAMQAPRLGLLWLCVPIGNE